MSRARADNRKIVGSEVYATVEDFERIFTEDMGTLYLLSFLLTGNRDKAEECFVAGLGESTKGNPVFKEWARSRARRMIIQSAIRLVAPRRESASAKRNPDVAQALDKVPLGLQAEVCAILELAPLERFVFVMSALERYSDHECSILLGCGRRAIAVARARAVRRLGRVLSFQQSQGAAGSVNLAVLKNAGPVIELAIARHFATSVWSRSLSP